MAEAHAAVAFTFVVSSDGCFVDLNKSAIFAVAKSSVRALKKRVARWKNSMHNQVYPFHPLSLILFASVLFVANYLGLKCATFPISYTHYIVIQYLGIVTYYCILECFLFALVLWFFGSLLNQVLLKMLLSYTGWLYVSRNQHNIWMKIWAFCIRSFQGRKTRLFGYQYSLPNLPLPSLKDTLRRYLQSVAHLLPDEEYEELVKAANEFQNGKGKKLQLFLRLKTWLTSNYVSDWWEEYIYLASRDPLLSNSNYYGIGSSAKTDPHPTQSARAAMFVYLLFQARREYDHQELPPILINGLIPLCSWQYERQFNTTRIAQLGHDKLVHYSDSSYIVVQHRGRYYRCPIQVDGQYLTAAEIEYMFDNIIFDNTYEATKGEDILGALTAGPRDTWAIARSAYFASGVNRTSLDTIDRAAFFLCLDDDSETDRDYDIHDPKDLSELGKIFLTGKGYNRWFDKSFTIVFLKNGYFGLNVEHTWADAPIMSQLIEYISVQENKAIDNKSPGLHYIEGGRCHGELRKKVLPTRLRWEISESCIEAIESSYKIAKELIDSLDLYVFRFKVFASNYMKKCRCSPDAFVQVALQLAYYMHTGRFCLTYESAMTRLYREGRTETVRSCTKAATEFVHTFLNKEASREEKIKKFDVAVKYHSVLTRDAMCGKGVDRHLFALYVVSRFLKMDTPFLEKILSEPWRLSTSQSPVRQNRETSLPENHPAFDELIGGGFGPVDVNGYGVSYVFSSGDVLSFHVSSKFTCPNTSSKQFADCIQNALLSIKKLYDDADALKL